jgi:hypothetical protein
MKYFFWCFQLLTLSAMAQELNLPRVEQNNPKFYALLISEQSYGSSSGFPRLAQPRSNAMDLMEVLVSSYSFDRSNVTLLVDKPKDDILGAIETVSRKLGENDNLLIFFAGHGTYRAGNNPHDYQGYLVPVDGVRDRFYTLISTDELTSPLNFSKARHILIITDACYSGALVTRGDEYPPMDIRLLYSKPSRQLMASGNFDPVPDNSAFIYYLIKNLKDNSSKYLASNDLFNRLQGATINNTGGETLPICLPIHNVGDEMGQFIFIRSDGNVRPTTSESASYTLPTTKATRNEEVSRPDRTAVPEGRGTNLPGGATMHVNVEKAKDQLKANDVLGAKATIDRLLDDPSVRYDGEDWYTKLKIYNAIAAGAYASQYPDARDQAFDALKKYVEVDDKKLIFLQLDGYKPVNEIYQGYFQVGATDYNNGHYDNALRNFQGAIAASTFMTSQGWTRLPIDTTSTLYAGISAEKAGKKDIAAIYYGKLANAGIASINGTNMIDIYKWLVDYYHSNKEDAKAEAYLRLAEGKFPNDLFWPSTRIDMARERGDKDALWTAYDIVVARFPQNHLFFFNYGLELYQYANDTSSGHRPANYESLIEHAGQMLKRCLDLQPDYPQAALVLGQIYYNQAIDLQGQTKKIPGKAPDDIKARADLRIAAGKKFDEAIPYFEQVDRDLGSKGRLKMDEKSALKDAYDLLTNIYTDKNIKYKIDYWTNKYNNVDKDH